MHVVNDEDYYTGRRIQRALKTGAKSEILFGRNEGGGQRFHRWVDQLIELDDAELAGRLHRRRLNPRRPHPATCRSEGRISPRGGEQPCLKRTTGVPRSRRRVSWRGGRRSGWRSAPGGR